MNIAVLGCGRWGSFLAWYLDSIGHTVTLYGRASSARMQRFLNGRTNGLVTLPHSLRLCTDLPETLADAQIVVISVGAQNLRGLCTELSACQMDGRTVVLCMKGLEQHTGLRLSQVAAQCLPNGNQIAVWLGPGHVQEMAEGIPNCMVLDSENEPLKRELAQAFSSDLIRFYFGDDLLGNEIGAAAKNVIGIAAGMLDGFGLTSLKGALMSRGTFEVSRLIEALGGKARSAYGLCHLGDYQATVFSPYSHNRSFGEAFVRGEPYTLLAEGYYTIPPILELGRQAGVELPICEALYRALYEKQDAKEILRSLFLRSLKAEFYRD